MKRFYQLRVNPDEENGANEKINTFYSFLNDDFPGQLCQERMGRKNLFSIKTNTPIDIINDNNRVLKLLLFSKRSQK